MTNTEAAEEIQKAIDLIRQDGKDWLDERDIPILEMAINALKKEAWKEEHPVSPLLQKPALTAQPETHEERTETHACDCIERQAAIDAMKSISDSICGQQAIDALCDLLSAQPEIVMCKDCENWIPGYITDNDDFIPPKCGKYQQMVGHSSDDFCSFAERRTDEKENI